LFFRVKRMNNSGLCVWVSMLIPLFNRITFGYTRVVKTLHCCNDVVRPYLIHLQCLQEKSPTVHLYIEMLCPGSFHIPHSLNHQLLYSPLLCSGLFFSFVICFIQTVGLLGRVVNPSQGRNLHTGQHKHRINAHTDIHALWDSNPRSQRSSERR
jgi:hypothetical protein